MIMFDGQSRIRVSFLGLERLRILQDCRTYPTPDQEKLTGPATILLSVLLVEHPRLRPSAKKTTLYKTYVYSM